MAESNPASFNYFFQKRFQKSVEFGVKPGNEERLILNPRSAGQVALLYVHGFRACRAEGEYVVEILAKIFGASAYFIRLPGHGTWKEDLNRTGMDAVLEEAEATLLMMKSLGKKVVLMGTSMGGLVATYLAAMYPDRVDGLVLFSPFYDFARRILRVLSRRPFCFLVRKIKTLLVDTDPVPPVKDNWTRYWYPTYYFSSLGLLMDLKRHIVKKSTLARVTAPALMLYFYRDRKNQDPSASVAAMRRVFGRFGAPYPNWGLRKMMPVPEGNHVLMSKYVHSDKDVVIREVTDFIRGIIQE